MHIQSVLEKNFSTPANAKHARTLEAAKAVYLRACETVSYSDRITRDSLVMIERSENLLKKTKQL